MIFCSEVCLCSHSKASAGVCNCACMAATEACRRGVEQGGVAEDSEGNTDALRFMVTQTVPLSLLRSYILFSSFRNGSLVSCTIANYTDGSEADSSFKEGPDCKVLELHATST